MNVAVDASGPPGRIKVRCSRGPRWGQAGGADGGQQPGGIVVELARAALVQPLPTTPAGA
jgi:hypothetical protein